ncbi:hypothetical protein [Jeotgalicoccus sp. FSL K6-3177]|uniref:hypothetical protein n=1 Tax=Jeotgalicoccus sp. FSL K6-3177 TaxID=2921494 RepID=UPI0030FD7FE7
MNDFEVKLWQEKTVQNPTDNEGVDMGYTFSLPDGKSTVDEVFEIAQNAVRKEPSLDRLTKRQVQLIIKAYEDVTGMYDET